jgi:hypothetical protein
MKHNTNRRTPKPLPIRFTIANALLAAGQKLRADETATATTFALGYAAKWAQASQEGGRR